MLGNSYFYPENIPLTLFCKKGAWIKIINCGLMYITSLVLPHTYLLAKVIVQGICTCTKINALLFTRKWLQFVSVALIFCSLSPGASLEGLESAQKQPKATCYLGVWITRVIT